MLGATASGAGDDFHTRWVARELLRLLDPASGLVSVKVEGLPHIPKQSKLAAHAQTVDVALTLSEGETARHRYLQLKYSPSEPSRAWTWSRLLQRKRKHEAASSVLGKLAGLMRAQGFTDAFQLVTNQPLSPRVRKDVEGLASTGRLTRPLAARQAELCEELKLKPAQLRAFLRAWDLAGFETASRLELETQVMASLAELTDADARQDALALHRHVVELMLPEGHNHPPITRETLLIWLGAGSEHSFFPAPSRIEPPLHCVPRERARQLAQRLHDPTRKPLRVHAEGGCGKTSLLTALPALLPPGSELFLYDCYGDGLFLTEDQRRHRPEQAFTQIANELAGRLRTPFVLRRENSVEIASRFLKRVEAAARIVATRGPGAVLVIAFDAVDNARIGARRFAEPCFLDSLCKLSGWPDNVRMVVTGRTARRDDMGPADQFEDFKLTGFDRAETLALVAARQPGWPETYALELHELSGGNPRRLTYALDGLGQGDFVQARARLMPRATSINPLFERLVAQAGVRLGNEPAIWEVLTALARLPRPVPAGLLSELAGLTPGDIADIATDVGGMVAYAEGWSFQDEDFEHFVDEHSKAQAPALLARAADLIEQRASHDRYAAGALAQVLVSADRLDALYALVIAQPALPGSLSPAQQDDIRARRLAFALRACRAAEDIATATQLLITSAEARNRQKLLEQLITDNLDLSARFEPDAAMRLVMVGSRHRKRRACFRIERAAALVEIDPAEAQRHFRWWREYLAEQHSDPGSSEIKPETIAAEQRHLVAGDLARLDPWRLLDWKPRTSVWRAVARLCRELAGRDPTPLLNALDARSWPPPVTAGLLAAALLAGARLTEPRAAAAFETLARAHPTRWPRTDDHARRGPLVDGSADSVLFICERAAAIPALHPALRRILASHFPEPAPQQSYELYRISSGAWRFMRALALRELVDDAPVTLEDWLPPRRAVAAEPRAARYRPIRGREKGENEVWNETREAVKAPLERILRAARATLAMVQGKVSPAQGWAAFADGIDNSRNYSGRPREGSSALAMVRAHLVHQALDGGEVTPLIAPARRLLKHWWAASPAEIVELARALALAPPGHDAALALLSMLSQEAVADPGTASDQSRAQVDYARAALPLDGELARIFFARATRATQGIDHEARAQLRAARAIAAAGLGGTQADRAALGRGLADAAARVEATLELGGDFEWRDVARGALEADPTTGLAVAACWHDRGLADHGGTLPEMLASPAARVFTPEQRYALAGLCERRPGLEEVFESSEPIPPGLVEQSLEAAFRSGEESQFDDALRAVPPTVERDSAVMRKAAARRDCLGSWRKRVGSQDDEESSDEQPCEPIRTEAALQQTFDARRHDGRIDANWLGQIAPRIAMRNLRTRFLDMALALIGNDGELGKALPGIVAAWRDYPPVASWARSSLPGYIGRVLPALFGWYDETDQLDALLEATGLDRHAQAELVLESIAQHAEALSASNLFALVSLLAARVAAGQRNLLLETLIARIDARAERPPRLRLPGHAAPSDPNAAVAQFLFAALGDCDRRVRWRAAHGARLLLEAQDPATEALVACLADGIDPAFDTGDFYSCAAQEQLMVTLWRVAEGSPEAVARFAPQMLAHLRGASHLIVREAGRNALLALAQAKAIALSSADAEFLTALNRPQQSGTASQRRRTGRYREEQERAFQFDEMDTIPYWYERVASMFDLPMRDLLDRIERWIHATWGYDDSASDWDREPRPERLRDEDRLLSNRHGSNPTIERLRIYLEWHGLLCAMGELVDTIPLAEPRYPDDGLVDWLARHLPHHAPLWLSDLVTPPPLEPRFWGHMPTGGPARARVATGEDNNDDVAELAQWSASLDPHVFEQEIRAANGDIVVAADFTLRWRTRTQQVDIRSALVTRNTGEALARAMLTARERMDFLVPGVGEHSEIKRAGYEFLGWLHYHHHEGGADRFDPLRGGIGGIPVSPHVSRTGGHKLQFDPQRMAYIDEGGCEAIGLACWGSDSAAHGAGWRATAAPALLDSMLNANGMSLLLCAEMARGVQGNPGTNEAMRWAIWLYEPGSGLRRVEKRRRDLGRWLVRKHRLERSTDWHARWLLHHAVELDAMARAAPPAQAEELAGRRDAICARFTHHRGRAGHERDSDWDD